MNHRKYDLFDIYVVRAGPPPPGVELPFSSDKLKFPLSLDKNERRVKDNLGFDEAFRWVSFMQTGTTALFNIVPARYRVATITPEQARVIAEQKWLELVGQGMPLDPLDKTLEDDLWWSIGSDHRDWQAQGLIPGRVWFNVDKLDGHLVSEEEVNEYFKPWS
jgi:hypothetical protein